jgi:hypothetical protein
VRWCAVLVVASIAGSARAEDPAPKFVPTVRAGVRGGVFGLIDPRSPGLGGQISGTLGGRLAPRWSVVVDATLDLGWWNSPNNQLLFGWSAMAGVDYTARDAFARGSSWQAALLAGPWMAAVCDSVSSPRCTTLMPAATIRWSVLPESGHTPVGPRASWALGISGTLGYDLGVTELVGRVALFAGVEWF